MLIRYPVEDLFGDELFLKQLQKRRIEKMLEGESNDLMG